MVKQENNKEARERVNTQIAELPNMERTALVTVWNKHFQTPPPPKLRKQLMVPILAYRIQEAEFGGLSQSARRRLDKLIAQNRAVPAKPLKGVSSPKGSAKLIRSWGGDVHEVTIVDSGYHYRDETYKSLSAIARKITGTQWSGPAFFGTRAKDRKR